MRTTIRTRLRATALAAVMAITSFAVTAVPGTPGTSDPADDPLGAALDTLTAALAPDVARAAWCASVPSFTGYLTASATSTTLISRTTSQYVWGYLSNVDAAWSCTNAFRFSALSWNITASLGRFNWGNLINSTSVACNWVVNSTDYLKANHSTDCADSDAEYAMRISFDGQRQYNNNAAHTAEGHFSWAHSDCGTYYGVSNPDELGERHKTNVTFATTDVDNRPGSNCDPIVLDNTGVGQTVIYDATVPSIAFDTPATGTGPTAVGSASVGVQFDATDGLAGFGGANGWALQRQKATWNGSACGTFANDTTTGHLTSGTTSASDQVVSQGLATDTCYRWTLSATDQNGNAATTATSGVIRVDDLSAHLGRQAQHTFESWDLGAGDTLSVNVATGNLVLDHPLVSLPIRGSAVDLGLTYNRHDASDVGMSAGWRLNMHRRLAVNGSTVTFTDADGSRHAFSNPQGTPIQTYGTRPATLYATLTRNTGVTPNQFTLTYRDQSKDIFEVLGSEAILIREQDRHGNGVDLTYVSGTNRISKIRDTAASPVREIDIAYDGSNRVQSITDWAWVSGGTVQTTATGARRVHRFFYNGSGQLIGWSNPLNTANSCTDGTPSTASHLTCLLYPSGALEITKTQTYTTIGGSPAVLGTATRSGTDISNPAVKTRVSFAGAAVTLVRDAEETGADGTLFGHAGPYESQVVRRGSGLSMNTTTRYARVALADPYARIATVKRKLGADWVTRTVAYHATYLIEPTTITENAGALHGAPARVTSYAYEPNTLGRLLQVIEPLDGTYSRWTDYTYNANNDVTQKIVSRQGDGTLRTTTRYCYHATTCNTTDAALTLGRVIENYTDGTPETNRWHDQDVTTAYEYVNGQRTRETRQNYTAAGGSPLDSRALAWTYDDKGNQTSVIANLADGTVTSPGDDIDPDAATGARTDLTTTYTYDTAGNRVSVADPRRAIEAAKGTSLGTDAYITRFTFDALNRQLTEKTPTDPFFTITQKTATTAYDEFGAVRTTTDFGNLVSGTLYDRAGRATATYEDPPNIGGTTPAVATGASTYDPSGRTLTARDQTQLPNDDRGWTAYAYDELGRATRVTEAYGSNPSFPSATLTAYDGLDRVICTQVGWTSGACETAGAAGLSTITSYDIGGRVISVNDEFTCTTTTYDWRGLATQVVEGRTAGTPCAGGTRTINQTYDGLGRLTDRTVSGGPTLEANVYDSAGRVFTTSSVDGSTSRVTETVFNALDEPTTEWRYTNVSGTKSAQSWARANRDPVGNVTDRCTWAVSPPEWCKRADSGTWASPAPITKSSSRYDARNQRVELYVPGQGTTSYDENHGYAVKGVFVPTASGHENQTVLEYDERHRPSRITTVLCAIAQDPCAGGNVLTTRVTNEYDYDVNGNRIRVLENHGGGAVTRYYCYDARNRLEKVSTSSSTCAAGVVETYGYDVADNRTSAAGRTFTYTTAGQLATCSGTNCAPTHDAEGRITKATIASGTWSYLYDGEGRLTSACKSSACAGSGFDRLDLVYDGEGHRIRIVEIPASGPVRTTDLRYEGGRVVGETETHNGVTTTRQFTLDEAGAIVKVAIATTGGSTTYDGTYLVNWNGHGDAIALEKVESAGTLAVANRFSYTTWGTPSVTTHNGHPDHRFRYRYVGRLGVADDSSTIVTTGLLYMHARHYSPELGRFLTPDPSALEANLYAYGANSPVTKVDPSGTVPVCLVPVAGQVFCIEAAKLALGGIVAMGSWVATQATTRWVVNGPRISFPCLWNCGPQVARTAMDNNAWGKAWEASGVRALRFKFPGFDVRTQVHFRTPSSIRGRYVGPGGRLFDACIYTSRALPKERATLCFDFKTGLSRNRSQELKDEWLMGKYPFRVIYEYGIGRTGKFGGW